jgi:hypothetical protein
MKCPLIASTIIASASVLVVGVTLAAQDRYTLKSPSGISFSEFKGYEQWQLIAPSQADDATGCSTSPDPGCIKAILGNPTMVKAYADGIPENGKAVPDGAAFAKIEWAKTRHSDAGAEMTVPGNLAEVGFMVKDSKRFPNTDGWGYATFKYDIGSDTWRAFGDGLEFVEACHACHTIVKARDFVFTHYPKR